MQFQSKQCAFLGCSSLHKGYKCLDISTGHVYISRDIVFDETVFPFASLHSNAGALLRAEINLLPLNLQPLHLHGHEGHDLQVGPDGNPISNGIDEFILQDSSENSVPGDVSEGFSGNDIDPEHDSDQSLAQQSPAQSFSGSESPGAWQVLGAGAPFHATSQNLPALSSTGPTTSTGHQADAGSPAVAGSFARQRLPRPTITRDHLCQMPTHHIPLDCLLLLLL